MGTKPNQKIANDIIISRSNVNKTVDPASGKSTIAGNDPAIEAPAELKQPERSFAQPSPVAPPKPVQPMAHASQKDEEDALKRNSTKPMIHPLAPKPVMDENTEETK